MCLLDYLFGKDRSRARDRGSQRPSDAQPPYDLLDRHYRLPGGLNVKIVGFQYGGKVLRVPFVLRCRDLDTMELLLVDPDFIRRFGTEIIAVDAKLEALRKPYVTSKVEVLRVVGWEPRIGLARGKDPHTDLVRIAEEDGGEGDQ